MDSRRRLLHAIILHTLWQLSAAAFQKDIVTTFAKEIVYPKRISCQVLQQKSENSEICSNLYTEEKFIFYEIITSYNYKNIYLTLKPREDFLTSGLQLENLYGDLYLTAERYKENRKCFYEGTVFNNLFSRVSLNVCDGLQGLITTSDGDFLISPTATSTLDNSHSLSLRENGPKHDNASRCATSEIPTTNIYHDYEFKIGGPEGVSLVKTHHRQRRASSVKQYVETMIVADESMFAFYDKKEIELRRYLLSVMAVVSSIMKDSTIGNFVDVAVVRLLILKKNPPDLKISSDASHSLRKFCRWQKRQNKRSDAHPEHYDTAILITRKDLCSHNKCETLGLAERGSVCDPIRSCSVVEDNGLSVAFTIAHELGHLLDAPHDGVNNLCTEELGKVHIMTPSFSMRSKTWTWSACSRKHITNFLESAEASCLADKPSPKFEHPLPHKLPGEMFSKTEQCQLIYGKYSTVCPFVRKCSLIWCIDKRNIGKSCHTNNMPWADGTKCDPKSWCIRGKCERKHEKTPVNGEWGEWGEFGACSRTCGGGIRAARRRCDNPPPSSNGDYCTGERDKYLSCQPNPCNPAAPSFRAHQCALFNGVDVEIPTVPKGVKWIPRYGTGENCKLWCAVEGKVDHYYALKPKVVDGTKCSEDSNDICIAGKCQAAGCDNILSSNAIIDKCGVCHGDNSTCRTIYGSKNTSSSGYSFVVNIPVGAINLKVEQVSKIKGTSDSHFLVLVDDRGEPAFNGRWRVTMGRKTYRVRGNDVLYSGPSVHNENIVVAAKLKTALQIKVLSTDPNTECTVRYSYNYPVTGEQKFKWVLRKDWTSCYPQCKGHQSREYECQREIDNQVVSDKKCSVSVEKPRGKTRSCNSDCQLRWTVFKSECSPLDTCGEGVQDQKITCEKVFHDKQRPKEILLHKACHKAKIGKKPAREVPCYAPCTTARWEYSEWTKCNATCDRGYQWRNAVCKDQSSNDSLPPHQCNTTTVGPLVRPCNEAPCPKWHTGAWSGACSVTCDKGYVERQVHCVHGGKKVPASQCLSTSKPSETRPCQMGPCAAWKFRPWSKCSKLCGAGYQTREVFCESGVGERVTQAECAGQPKPKDRRRCFEKACELKVKVDDDSLGANRVDQSAQWISGDWKECSQSCGGGVQSRAVGCMLHNDIVADTECAAEQQPNGERACNEFSCPFWRHGQWSKCTKPCDSGTQTRLVLCGFNGTIVDDAMCDVKHKHSQKHLCNQEACPEQKREDRSKNDEDNDDWDVAEWSQCSTTCGVGSTTRAVVCKKKECNPTTKPTTLKQCAVGQCPTWNYGEWAPCQSPLGCGSGWQIRLVVCQATDGRVLNNSACAHTQKPAHNHTCAMHECKRNAQWVMTPWQPCDAACGNGTQYRYVSCEDRHGNSVSEQQCMNTAEERPPEQKPCTRSVCPKWMADQWQRCDGSCRQYRVVECRTPSQLMNENMCDVTSRPSAWRECSGENCVRQEIYKWHTGKWTKCGRTCGYSLHTRKVTCQDESGKEVNGTHCEKEKRPKDKEQCFEALCPPLWKTTDWSECSASCGGGVQTRDITCRGEGNARLADIRCSVSDRPSVKRSCNVAECGDIYQWVASPWTKCTRSCGVGQQHRDVFCVGDNTTQPRDKCRQALQPKNFRVCNVHYCPLLDCRDVQREFKIYIDGEHVLNIGNRTLKVYCEGMHRKNPKEFISLIADPKENYAEIYGKRLRHSNTCPNGGRRQIPCVDCVDHVGSGLTFFKKLRLDVRRMTVIAEDKTFSDQFGSKPPSFATAGDCYSRKRCAQGTFMINLKGTGLRVANDVTWQSRGYYKSKRIRKLKNNQVVYGKCGGYCGMCSPNYRTGLKLEVFDEIIER